MEDIGNLIYYILIFAVAIISWISGLTKKKQQQQQTSVPSPFPTQEMPAPPPAVPRKKKQAPPPVPKRLRQEPYSGSFSSSNYNENTPVLLEEEAPSIADELDLNNAETFRKAIIYSEILNRKEW